MTDEAVDLDVADDGDEEGDWDDARWPVRRPRRWWGWTAFLLSLAGFGDSMYLTVEHFTSGVLTCPDTGIVNCLKVTTSPESEVFGVFPVALLGLLFYAAVVAINVPALWSIGGPIGQRLAFARLGLMVTGIGMVLYLLAAELFSIKAICLYCTGVHVVTFALFVLVVATFSTMASGADLEPDG